MRIIGIDPSLTATGLATPEQVTTLRPPAGMKGPERLGWIRRIVLLNVFHLDRIADLVVLEGYSYASAHGAHQLGELGGVLRVALWEAGIPYVEVPPTKLKKYATGKGIADKGAVLTAAVRRLGYEGSDHNQADAMWLKAMADDHYHPDVTDALWTPGVPKANRAVLDQIDWPDLKVPA